MEMRKFLTIYAVLDQRTQNILGALQKRILKQYPCGTQTMGIPFHITLGSFPLDKKEELLQLMENIKELYKKSPICLLRLNHFNHKVIFIEPSITKELQELHQVFDGDYANGYDWHPHVTLYCGAEEEGKEIINQFSFSKLDSYITGLELGEFFPTKIIYSCDLK